MKATFARLVLGGLAAVALITTQAAPAGATVNAGVGVVQGGGTITPGLTAVPSGPQNFTFTSATITSVGVRNKSTTTVGGTSNCTASGSSTVRNPTNNAVVATLDEGSAGGTGSGTWGCSSGPLAGKGGKLYYVRVGPVVAVVLTDGNKPPTGAGALVCLFVPNNPTFTTSYALTCVGAVADAK